MSSVSKIEAKLTAAKDRVVHKLKVVQDQLTKETRDTLALDINSRKLKHCHERVMELRTDLETAVASSKDKEVIEKFEEEIIEYEILSLDCEEVLAEIEAICEHEQKSKETSKLHNSSLEHPVPREKLPELPKVTFNGDITTYQEFKQNFEVTIGATTTALNRKLTHLKEALVDAAENDLKGLPTTKENYDRAWQMLEDKYGNTTRTIQILYNKITHLSESSSSTTSLRKTYDEIEVILRTLESMGESFNNNTILFNTIIKKFPNDIVYEAHQGVSDALSLINFRLKIKEIIQKREQLNFNTAMQEKPATYTTEALAVKASSSKTILKKPAQRCIYCSSEKHWSDECDVYVTLEARKEVIKGRCYICLRKNHVIKECTCDRTCVHCGQRKNHHRSLCPKLIGDKTPKVAEKINDSQPTPEKIEKTTNCLLSVREQNWLMTAVTQIINPALGIKLNARLVLDGGSKRTYIKTETADHLQLPAISEEHLVLDTVGETQQQMITSRMVQFQVNTRLGNVVIEANTIPKIIDDIETFDPNELPDKSILRDKPLADTSTRTDVQILIGIDHLYDFLTPEMVEIGQHQYLVNSKLGWLFAGKLPTNNRRSQKSKCLLLKTIETETNTDLKQLWDLDTLGIKTTPEVNDELALKLFESTVKYEDNRYTVEWPWIEENPELKSHYGLALSRLENLVKKSSAEFLSKYNDVFKSYLAEGIIELVDDTTPADNLVHYLPHQGIETSSKSTPLRPVFDGSAKQSKNDKSLNDCIYKGQNLNELLAAILLLFQTHEHAVYCDIMKAFLQILLALKDRDSVRFLWLKNPQLRTMKNNIAVYRFRRILFGASASPFLLAATIRHHLAKYPRAIVLKILKAIYVDNIATGTETIAELSELIDSLLEIFSEASMTLRQWQTNEKQLIEKYPDLEWTSEAVVSVLGLNWNTAIDTLSLKPIIVDTTLVTKRSILKFSSKVYDPLGYFSSITLRAKLILRQLWEQNYNWDQPIPSNFVEEWHIIVQDLISISAVQIPRKFPLPKVDSNLQLHVFADASERAYGVVVYVRMELGTRIKTKLLFAKSRVAPLKPLLKIPRLELLAATIGSRALRFVEESLYNCHFDKKFLWSDSMCTIAWINSVKALSPFVERRAKEIRDCKLQINYVKSEENPADIASRGATLSSLNELWWNGPIWLQKEESSWPSRQIAEVTSVEFQSEIREPVLFVTDNTVLIPPFNIQLSDHNSWNELLLETIKQSDDKLNVESAAKIWIEYVQRLYFQEEFDAIRSGTISNLIKQLNLVQYDGILRVKGRLSHLSQSTDDFPILLPGKNNLTKLIIVETHTSLYHAGVSQTLAEIRKKYWLLRGRQTVYNVIKKCKNCKVFSGPAYKYPTVPPLPGYRLKRESAFAYVGIDVLGHLFIRKHKKTDLKKNWILLVTCLITRAVHLEVLEEMTTEELLNSLRLVFSRRGIPKFILSDNAPQFNVLKDLLTSDQRQYLDKNEIVWKQIPEFAPWSGGIYERMVALVKEALKRTFYQVTLTRRQLQIATSEIEAIINSRPLVYVGTDDQFVLSPRDLLNIPWNIPDDFNPTNPGKTLQEIAVNWKNGRQQLDAFWNIWRTEYIEKLRPVKGKSSTRCAVNEVPKVNDTVLLQEKNLPRGKWRIGKIIKLNVSSDEAIRSAVVQVENGSMLTRPTCLLHPLESEAELEPEAELLEPNSQPSPAKQAINPAEIQSRIPRQAAIRAKDNIRRWVEDL